MKINSKFIKMLKDKEAKIQENAHLLSENLKTVQDRNGEKTVTIKRGGKKIKLKEKVLWDEVYALGGKENDAADFLREKYPEIFEMYDAGQKMATELKKFLSVNLNVDIRQMTFLQTLELNQAIIRHELRKWGFALVGILAVVIYLLK